jgi:uncharacterized protein involved in exopolysaccharide biosynthesis
MLNYDQPINQAKPDDRKAAPRGSAGFSVLQLTRLLWRQRVAIAAAALICACAAVVIGKSLTPKYAATAQLYVDPRELQLVDRELTPRTQDLSGLAMVVESQARLITSNSVLLRVIQDTGIDKDPEFGGESRGMLASLLGLFGLEFRSSGEAKPGESTALEALNRHINVKKTDRSFIVDVEVWSYDPAKAAMLANALSGAYLAESKTSQSTAARRATTDLSGRLKELQARLRNAENALATYKAQNNFVGTQDTLISDQQLSASNQRLAAARALALDAQAKYDQIEASRRAATDAGAIPEALQSPTIANLRAQYAEARKRLAELTSELGPLHPSLRQMEKQVEDLRRTVNEEVDRFAQSAKNDLTRARDYEASLNNALETQKRQSVQLSQASVRLRELERDVEASRDVYQSFLKPQHLECAHHRRSHRAAAAHLPAGHEPARDDRLHVRRAGCRRLGCRGRPAVARGGRTATGPCGEEDAGAAIEAAARKSTNAAAGGGTDRKAADRASAGIGRIADLERNPDNPRDSRCHAHELADATRRPPADEFPQRHARHARGLGEAFSRQRDPGAGRDRRGRQSRSQRRGAQRRASRRARRR